MLGSSMNCKVRINFLENYANCGRKVGLNKIDSRFDLHTSRLLMRAVRQQCRNLL